MARIPAEEIERLKREVSLERLAEARGIRLQRHGADLLGLCPFHEDREPSLVITPTKNLWHCLGACQAGGSVIDWVMRAEGVSFRHAVELLREDLPLAASSRPVKVSTVPKLPRLLERDVEDEQLLRQVVRFYHETLKESPEALGYLEKRGLQSAEAIERFQLGFANRNLAYRLPAKNRREGEAIRSRLQRLGILRESGHEHLNGSLVVPVFDEEGRVAELYGRKVTPNLRPGTPLHLYLPGPHRGVWNVEALQAHREIILCEALLDALTFWCAGFRNVTASYGVEGFTDDHWKAFRRYGTERVLLAYDRDGEEPRARDPPVVEEGELAGVGVRNEQRAQEALGVATANRLAHEVLGRSLDELPPQTRRLLGLVAELVAKRCAELGLDRADYRFTRRDVRAWTGWSDFQVRAHVERLVALEYVLVHRGARGQSFVYELLYDGQGEDGSAFLVGLLEPERLPQAPPQRYDGDFEGVSADFEGPSSPHRAPNEPTSRAAESDASARRSDENGAEGAVSPENARLGSPSSAPSYVPTALPLVASGARGR